MKTTCRAGGRLVRVGLVRVGLICAAGCTSVAPLAPLAVKWGADLISAAANNYSPQYSQQLETLLLAVYSDQVAKKMQGQQAGQAAYPSAAGQAQPHPEPAYPASPTPADPYPTIGAASSNPYPPQTAPSSDNPYPPLSQASSLTSSQQGSGTTASPYPPAG